MTNDLLVAAGYEDKVEVRDRCGLTDILQYDNCHLSRPNLFKIRRLVKAAEDNTYCVHVHCGPIPSIRYFLRRGSIRATYIFRDPRDVVVSAYRHGVRERKEGLQLANFAKLRTVSAAIHWVRWRQLPRYAAWKRIDPGQVLMTRYEDLVEGPVEKLGHLRRFLGVNVSESTLADIVNRYDSTRRDARELPGLHFDRGGSGRFRSELTQDQIELCNRLFRGYLISMGYEI